MAKKILRLAAVGIIAFVVTLLFIFLVYLTPQQTAGFKPPTITTATYELIIENDSFNLDKIELSRNAFNLVTIKNNDKKPHMVAIFEKLPDKNELVFVNKVVILAGKTYDFKSFTHDNPEEFLKSYQEFAHNYPEKAPKVWSPKFGEYLVLSCVDCYTSLKTQTMIVEKPA